MYLQSTYIQFSKALINTNEVVQSDTKLEHLSSMLHVSIHTENPTRCNSVSKFITPCLYEAQHVSDDSPPIIRRLKLHWQPLVLHTWKVVGHELLDAVGVQQPHVQQPSTYAKPEAASAVLGF